MIWNFKRSSYNRPSDVLTHTNSFALQEYLVAWFLPSWESLYYYLEVWNSLQSNSWGFQGSLPMFIGQFLSDWSFQVQLGETYSEKHILENGVPLGLSSTGAPVSASLVFCGVLSMHYIFLHNDQMYALLHKIYTLPWGWCPLWQSIKLLGLTFYRLLTWKYRIHVLI